MSKNIPGAKLKNNGLISLILTLLHGYWESLLCRSIMKMKNGAKEMQTVQNADKNRHQKLSAGAKVYA